VAKLTYSDAHNIALRGRPWTIRLECVDPGTNTSKFWYATGRKTSEKVECGWGRIGSKPQRKLITYSKYADKVSEKRSKGYEYADTPYVWMSAANLALLGGATPSPVPAKQPPSSPSVSTSGGTPPTVPATVASNTTTPPAPEHVNPSIPAPFGFIKYLRPSKGGGWEALDSNKGRLLDLPLDSGKAMLRDFASTIEILA